MSLPEAWETALQQRHADFDLSDPDLCVRLVHDEVEAVRCDRYGPVCWFYHYGDADASAADQQLYDEVCAASGARHWYVQRMQNRGGDPQTLDRLASADAPDVWHAHESGLRFELRATSGQSPGLFLDQRLNRQWVRQQASGGSILNLFAYTGGFGIAALAAGASEVVQVDVSRPYLDWSKSNAQINGLEDDRCEYSAVDSRLLVDGCHRRGRQFDGIICDPPSFGRSRRKDAPVWRVQQDLPELLCRCVDLLRPGGWVLCTSNFEGWTQPQFEAVVSVPGTSGHVAPGAGPECGGAQALLKSRILRR